MILKLYVISSNNTPLLFILFYICVWFLSKLEQECKRSYKILYHPKGWKQINDLINEQMYLQFKNSKKIFFRSKFVGPSKNVSCQFIHTEKTTFCPCGVARMYGTIFANGTTFSSFVFLKKLFHRCSIVVLFSSLLFLCIEITPCPNCLIHTIEHNSLKNFKY